MESSAGPLAATQDGGCYPNRWRTLAFHGMAVNRLGGNEISAALQATTTMMSICKPPKAADDTGEGGILEFAPVGGSRGKVFL